MIVSIHQPHFLPWLGYFNKVFHSDVFVWLHNVQYRKNYFQNRTKIKNPFEDKETWLTVPVKASLSDSIDQVKIADATWVNKAIKTIDQFYRRAPYFDRYFEKLINTFDESADLDGINYKTFSFLLKELEYPGKVVRVEDIQVTTLDPNDRLIEICQKLGSDHYIAGKGGKNYLEMEKWNMAGIKISWQAFNPEVLQYEQLGKIFVPALSIIDCLFNIGPEQTRERVVGAWKPE